ncbi:MAG TPA: hypothetical protein VGD77_12755 [Gemmatimonadaceae bacterium]
MRTVRGRIVVESAPADTVLARALAEAAVATDTFPGLPRPRAQVLVQLAPNAAAFRALTTGAPEWGAAIALPRERRIVMQGRFATSDAGDPVAVLRHELAHLALHEFMGELPPRWFDEGYAAVAAREWDRENVLATNVALALRGTPTLAELEEWFYAGSNRAQGAYALAWRAVADLSALDPARGLSGFFVAWRETGSMPRAVRRAYGITFEHFEERWQSRTRRVYGGLALFTDLTLGMVFTALLIVPLYAIRRRRDRERLAAMRAADEVAEREARESALEAILAPLPGEGGEPGSGPLAPDDDERR